MTLPVWVFILSLMITAVCFFIAGKTYGITMPSKDDGWDDYDEDDDEP